MLKYLLLILVIAGAWYGYRYVNRKKSASGSTPVTPPPAQPQIKAEDMAACRVCGAYVAEGTAKSCDRNDCPYPSV